MIKRPDHHREKVDRFKYVSSFAPHVPSYIVEGLSEEIVSLESEAQKYDVEFYPEWIIDDLNIRLSKCKSTSDYIHATTDLYARLKKAQKDLNHTIEEKPLNIRPNEFPDSAKAVLQEINRERENIRRQSSHRVGRSNNTQPQVVNRKSFRRAG